MAEPTPPQTIGPFFHDSLLGRPWNVVGSPAADGRRIRIEGRVLDGDGRPVDDALVEIWQADSRGVYVHPLDERAPRERGFLGFARSGTDGSGAFWFETVMPGPVPAPGGGVQAPHLNMQVFARGLLDRLSTRLYFDGDPTNAEDVVLTGVPRERRTTLLARRDPGEHGSEPLVYRFDVVLQGEGETVFFDL